MKNHSANTNTQLLWDRYRDNLPRHLLGLSRYLQSETMHELTDQRGHGGLKISFEPYISLVGSDGCRLTELADALAISKQACSQTARQIEAAGYITRIADPLDGRAKILVLTDHGQQLVRDGAETAHDLENNFRSRMGDQAISNLIKHLAALHGGLALPRARVDQAEIDTAAYLSGLLPRLADYILHRLMQLTINRGHPYLKMSHGQVLTLIGLSGGSIGQMAAIQEISKQAISAIVNDLEDLGYLYRQTDTSDARQQLIHFTPAGLGLLEDSVSSVAELDREFCDIVGESSLGQLKAIARELYQSLLIEKDVFSPSADINTLAEKLKTQLGRHDLLELSRLLQTDTEALA